MKRTERVGAIIKILSDHPGRSFGLGYFCSLFGAAKSSISEDLHIASGIMSSMELGSIETTYGAGGGVSFVPHISDNKCLEIQEKLCAMISDPSRILGGGFLYTSDIMFDPSVVYEMAPVFARKFRDAGADYVATIETKGIPLALMTARSLDIPAIVIRREAKISEGPTVSINYFSGTTDRIQKMSMSRKAARTGSKAIIIDDFMRAGGSLKGIVELLGEFDIEVCGTGVAIASREPAVKKISNYTPLVYLGKVDEDNGTIDVEPNSQIF